MQRCSGDETTAEIVNGLNTGSVYASGAYDSDIDHRVYAGGFVGASKGGTTESVSISGPDLVEVDDTITLKANVLPDDATNKSVVWKSDNPAVANVSLSGTVTGFSKGTAVITAETYNGKTASHTVEVLENAVYIEVRGFKKGEETKSYILPGAEVRIGNCVKLTNEDGIAHFERSDLPDTPTAAVTIDAGDDYVEKTDEICLILNTLGRHSFTYYVQYRTDEIYTNRQASQLEMKALI